MRMKKLLLLLALALVTVAPVKLSAQSWQWGRMGFPSEGVDCATDNSGNAYGLGDISSFVPWVIGPDTLNKSLSINTLYVVKYNGNGNVLWARGTENGIASPIAIETDMYGHVYIIGIYEDSVSFGTCHLHTTATIGEQYFVAKLDAAGDIIWAENLGNAYYVSWGSADIAADRGGNIVVAFSYNNNPVLGGFTFVNHDTTLATTDFVVAKLDSNGTVLWARSYGGNRDDVPQAIAVSLELNIYVAANFTSDSLHVGSTSIILDSGAASFNSSDLFIAKMDSAGAPLWAEQAVAGGLQGNYVSAIACDANDSAYVLGYYNDTFFRFGGLTLPYNLNAGYDCFVAALQPDGAARWLKRLTGSQIVPANIALDNCSGSVWVAAGVMHGPGADTIDGRSTVIPHGTSDGLLIAGWRADSTLIGITILQSGGDDAAGLSVNDSGSLFVFADIYSGDTMIIAGDTMITSIFDENFLMAKYNTGDSCSGRDTGGHGGGATFVSAVIREDVIIYPNPSTTQLTIRSAGAPIEQLCIVNTFGQVVCSRQLTAGGMQVSVDISALMPGVYMIRVNQSVIRKFVKL